MVKRTLNGVTVNGRPVRVSREWDVLVIDPTDHGDVYDCVSSHGCVNAAAREAASINAGGRLKAVVRLAA